MKRAFVLTICLVLAIMAAPAALTYLPAGATPYQTAIQSPVNPHDRSLSPGDTNKSLYVPSCTVDSSLLGKRLPDKSSTEDSSATGEAKSEISTDDIEIGSLRCQT